MKIVKEKYYLFLVAIGLLCFICGVVVACFAIGPDEATHNITVKNIFLTILMAALFFAFFASLIVCIVLQKINNSKIEKQLNSTSNKSDTADKSVKVDFIKEKTNVKK